MAMATCGTFDYVVRIPVRDDPLSFECTAQVRTPVPITGEHIVDGRLVGMAPVFRVSDGGVFTPARGSQFPLSRMTLAATTRTRATVAEAAFYVHSGLTGKLEVGDLLHLVRTECAGLGLSVIRGGKLMLAIGAITAVPLGPSITAEFPRELIAKIEGLVRRRDPEFKLGEIPIEVRVGRSMAVIFRGGRRLGDYFVGVRSGFIIDEPGDDVCAMIYREGSCPPKFVMDSLTLLADTGEMPLVRWEEGPAR